MQSLLSNYEAMARGSPRVTLHLGLNWQKPRRSDLIAFQSDSSQRYNDDGEETLIGSKFVVTPPITRHRREVP
jgi:hypothetical protein